MSFLGVVFYFHKSPRYLPENLIQAKLFAVALLTIFLPILIYFLLKSLGRIQSIHMASPKERILPLLINVLIVLVIVRHVLPYNEILELYFFFVGILLTTLSCLILAFFNVKASIHLAAAGGILMFFIAISLHFQININESIALVCLLTGALATSRLHVKAHTGIELAIGFFVGLLPQLILINNWL